MHNEKVIHIYPSPITYKNTRKRKIAITKRKKNFICGTSYN